MIPFLKLGNSISVYTLLNKGMNEDDITLFSIKYK